LGVKHHFSRWRGGIQVNKKAGNAALFLRLSRGKGQFLTWVHIFLGKKKEMTSPQQTNRKKCPANKLKKREKRKITASEVFDAKRGGGSFFQKGERGQNSLSA